jgi:phage terminase large subunit-like protein
MKLRVDQQQFLYRWYEHCGGCGQWRYNEALRGAATGDGKTQFIAAVTLLEFAGPPQIAPKSPNIPIAAASFDQANLLFSAVAVMCGGRDNVVKESPLVGFFEVYDTEIKFTDGRPGRIFRVAAVAGTNEGGLPSLFVRDELHEWGEPGSNKARVATVIGKSTFKRRIPGRGCGRIISLSTAGFDVDNSFLGQLYKLGIAARRNPTLAPRFLFDWREAPDDLDFRRVADRRLAVQSASAAAGVLWNVEDRVAEWGKPAFPSHEWIRYFANKWVDVAEESWLKDHPAAWGSCKGEWDSDPSNPFVVVIDMALKHDSVAVSRLEKLPGGRIAITTRIWEAMGGRIDHLDVFNHVKKVAVGPGFRGVVYDPRFFEVPARDLEDHGILVIQFDQSPQRMAPACGLTFQMILDLRIVHNGDEQLSAHVRAAVKRVQERGFTLSKGKSKRHIDAAITLCMGVWTLHDPGLDPIEPSAFYV